MGKCSEMECTNRPPLASKLLVDWLGAHKTTTKVWTTEDKPARPICLIRKHPGRLVGRPKRNIGCTSYRPARTIAILIHSISIEGRARPHLRAERGRPQDQSEPLQKLPSENDNSKIRSTLRSGNNSNASTWANAQKWNARIDLPWLQSSS